MQTKDEKTMLNEPEEIFGWWYSNYSTLLGSSGGGQNFLCKLTHLPLDIYFHNKDYMPSADRIDSQIGYQKGNIQITCSFANKWKNDYGNAIF